jgi:predicted NBD/HSP70 family sugar kinase
MSAYPKVLAVDVGGSNVKILASGEESRRKFRSGDALSPQRMVDGVLEHAADWDWEVVAVGIPAPVRDGQLVHEPVNLGEGWVDFDYAAAFGKPTRLINDAAMQALGSYEGGRMLFLGLGTGLGSAMVHDGHLLGLELAHMPYKKATYEDYVGDRGLDELGFRKWRETVFEVVEVLRKGLVADYVVLGGGNVKKLDKLPPHVRRGGNHNAFLGGFRLWHESPPGA